MNGVFAPTCERVVQLVLKQLSAFDGRLEGRKVTVLLVGGFGQSPYLFSTLEKALRERDVGLRQGTQW